MSKLSNVKIVLVRPKIGRNVGAVCRAMKTMGLTRLTVVGGGALDLDEARNVAVHATDVLDGAVYHGALADAVRDSAWVAGVTRRRGKRRKYFSLLPEELADRIAETSASGPPVCVLFGNEESGLSDEELEHCNLAVRIPSSPLFPSLNLSHAVQIVCYQIFRLAQGKAVHAYRPITGDERRRLVEVMLGSLANVGFFKQVGPEEMGIFLLDILARARLSRREARRVEKIFRKISGLCAGRGV